MHMADSKFTPGRREPDEADMRARALAAQIRREQRRYDPQLITDEGYLPEEIEPVVALRKKRDEWQKLGTKAEEFVVAELKNIEAEFAAGQAGSDSPRQFGLYRASRPLYGSTLDDKGAGFYPEFEPDGEFSTAQIIERIEKGLAKFKAPPAMSH
jgi:hypothetical protein